MQLATSLTPIDALGSPEDQVHPTEIPPDFFFFFFVCLEYISSSNTASVTFPPTLTDSLAKLICSFFLFHVIVYKNPKSTQNTFPTL